MTDLCIHCKADEGNLEIDLSKPLMTKSDHARSLQALRKTHGGGAPRKAGVKRCPCGKMTLKRATARSHKCASAGKSAQRETDAA